MEILDTTIRDGSYAVNFKFSCEDIKSIITKSYNLGIKYIEIGHGQGLSASSRKYGYSLHTDEEYMKAAKEAVPNAKLGFFCIPGIAKTEDLVVCKENGIDFVRVGINVKDYENAKKYIIEAKKNGLYVFVNFMKSYSVSPEELAKVSDYVYKMGADCVYIVDSAGCMLPNEIEKYIKAIRKKSNILIGFHGHNNMGLAVSNTLHCVSKKIDFIDCSFQGLGRSSGNASLEQVIMALNKLGYENKFDIPKALEYGYSSLRNIVSIDKLVNPLDYVCGYAGFHSSYLKHIYRCCNETKVDPLRLIIEYSKINVIDLDYDTLLTIAKKLPVDNDENPYSFADYFDNEYN